MVNGIDIIYFSPVFHTQKIVRAIADNLIKCSGLSAAVEHDVTPYSKDILRMDIPQDHVVIFGAPVYGGGLPKLAKERLKGISGNETPAILLVSYGNRAYEDSLLELYDLLKQQGFVPFAGAACIAEHTIAPQYGRGRPDQNDLKDISDFASQCYSIVKGGSRCLPDDLKIPGKRPYNFMTPFPLPQYVDDSCIHCNVCAEQCPVQAIDFEDQKKVNPQKCFCCMRCINICPVNARHPDKGFLENITNKLAPVASQPKKNSFFLAV